MKRLLVCLSALLLTVACGKKESVLSSGDGSTARGIISGAQEPGATWVGRVVVWNNNTGSSAQFCSGSLITPVHVLTAAHCFSQMLSTSSVYSNNYIKRVPYLVKFSNAQVYNSSQYVTAAAVFVPNYVGFPATQDIAIIRLKAPYPGVTQDSIPVWVLRDTNYKVSYNQNPIVTYGYGPATDHVRRIAQMIGEGTYPECSTGMGPVWCSENLFWVRSASRAVTTFGDSGGPLLIPAQSGFKARIIGVLRGGYTSASGKAMAAYVNPALYGAFLDDAIRQ